MQELFDKELERLIPEISNGIEIMLAVSGGIDSMCMAHLFLNSSHKPSISIAHMNFSLREKECDCDQDLVRSWADQHGIRFFTKKVDAHKYADEHSVSTQMAARELRYNWFNSLMEENSVKYLSIAHNLNDSVETLILNILRGTGLKGLSGIKEINGPIIRPLLSFSRAQISDFVKSEGISYREDETNKESHYFRNRVRNKIFPHFSAINPSFLNTIQKEMIRFAEVGDVMDALFKEKEGRLYRKEGDVFLIDIKALEKEKFENYWLFRMLDPYGFNDTQISQINASLSGQSGKTFISPSSRLVRDREYLKVYPNQDKEAESKVKIRVFKKPERFNPKLSGNETLYIDGRKVTFPLKCRAWKPADRFKPLGMNGFKKLSDFFTDLKLDIEEKKKQIVVTTIDKKGQEQIVCVVGLRIDERYKIRPATRQVVSITKI